MIVFDRERCLAFTERVLRNREWGPWAQAIGYERNGELLAVAVYNNLSESDISMHVAALHGRKWCVPEFLSAAFRYPFVQLGLRRVTAFVPATNERALKLDRHLGFVYEGRMREAGPDGEDMIVLGLLKSECRFYGQEVQAAAAA